MTTIELPKDWRDRLPDPALYYRQYIQDLSTPNATGWATGLCPFHTDRNSTLFVCLAGARSGSWRCGGTCGGGDMVDFQMRVYNQSLPSAVLYLLSYERVLGMIP